MLKKVPEYVKAWAAGLGATIAAVAALFGKEDPALVFSIAAVLVLLAIVYYMLSTQIRECKDSHTRCSRDTQKLAGAVIKLATADSQDTRDTAREYAVQVLRDLHTEEMIRDQR